MRRLIVMVLLALGGLQAAVAGKEYSCNMAAFSQKELEEYRVLATTMRSSVQETKELKNGYAFRLPAEELVATSQWISYERHCCPFFTFELEIPKDSGPVWLRITGESGIKEFIKTEFEL
jgi:hypothetical protein